MRVYHATSVAAAEAIRREGFRDATDFYMTRHEWTGVWIADQPLDENEGAISEALLILDVPVTELEPYEWVEDGKGYREWLVPAKLLNAYPITA